MLKTFSPQTPATIRATAEILRKAGDDLDALAKGMEDLGLAEIQATNADQRRRCMEYAEKFVAAVREGVRLSREHRGDFGDVANTNHKPKKKKS